MTLKYYLGTLEDFNKQRPSIAQKYEFYIYSEGEPNDAEHKYWHYGTNDEILIWE